MLNERVWRKWVFWLAWAAAVYALLTAGGAFLPPNLPWLVVPAYFLAVKWAGDGLQALCFGRGEVFFFEDAGKEALIFVLLGMAALPLLQWGARFGGIDISPVWPAAVAYITYTFWDE